MNEGVWVRGAAHEEFVCEVVDELADGDHLEVMVNSNALPKLQATFDLPLSHSL